MSSSISLTRRYICFEISCTRIFELVGYSSPLPRRAITRKSRSSKKRRISKTLIGIGLVRGTRVSYIDNVSRTDGVGTRTYKEDSIELATAEEGTDLSTRRAASTTSVVARYYNVAIDLDASSATDTLPGREITTTVYTYILASFR